MKLKSFGCSFTHGTDLKDTGRKCTTKDPSSYLTWPALLAKKHKLLYRCYARPGSGNLQILERLLTKLAESPEPAVYVVNWTWIDRFDYATENIIDKWRTVMPTDQDNTAIVYYRELHSEYQDKLTTLIYVKTAIDALTASGNKFIMTYMDELMFDSQWNTSPAVSALQNVCKPYMTRFDGKSFLEYSKEKGFPISKTLHPLEAAHEAAFKLIDSYNLV